jgi:hypothetical protein
MKVGDWLKCIDGTGYKRWLTKDKLYRIYRVSNNAIYIYVDSGASVGWIATSIWRRFHVVEFKYNTNFVLI